MEALGTFQSRICANACEFGGQTLRQGSERGSGLKSHVSLAPTVSGRCLASQVTAVSRDGSGNAASLNLHHHLRPSAGLHFGGSAWGGQFQRALGFMASACAMPAFLYTPSPLDPVRNAGAVCGRLANGRQGHRRQAGPWCPRQQSSHWTAPRQPMVNEDTLAPFRRAAVCSAQATSGEGDFVAQEVEPMPGGSVGTTESGATIKPIQWDEVLPLLTPLRVSKWGFIFLTLCGLFSLAWKLAQATALNPKFLMYASWLLVIWPWPAAIAAGAWTLKTAMRQKAGKAVEWEQLGLLGGALTWLILVPCGHFQGYVDGWPLALACFYFLFFCISSVVRLRLYGDLSPRAQDKQWATKTSRGAQVGFIISVVAGHWLAAREALYLEKTIGWSNALAWVLLLSAFVIHWKATFYLGKYFDRLVVPKTVVTYGPYRWVRHPIYLTYMMLFAGYCVALRSYVSLALLLSACMLYYSYRTKLEEDLLVEAFGELYPEYRSKTRSKFIPGII